MRFSFSPNQILSLLRKLLLRFFREIFSRVSAADYSAAESLSIRVNAKAESSSFKPPTS